MDKSKDPTDERKSGDINEEIECCKDGACSWHDNTTAQSDEDREKGGP